MNSTSKTSGLSPIAALEKSDALYAKRANVAAVLESLEIPDDGTVDEFESAWRISRARFFLGQEASAARDKRLHHRAGIESGARAGHLRPDRVEGHFWHGVNLALMAQVVNKLAAIRFALRARMTLARAIEIDSAYHGAGPLRVLARLEHKLPPVLGGGFKRSRQHFEEAIRIDGYNTVTRIYYAELLFDANEDVEANRQLIAVIDAPDDPNWQFEIDRDRLIARNRVGRMDRPKG